jgi:hypothetical protein
LDVTASPPSESERRVVPFRPRGSLFARHAPQPSPVEDLAKYEHEDGEDDYRHRMIVNGLAFAVAVLLVVGGIWIANTMAQMRKNQDCVLSGQRACMPIKVPIEPR